jgi:hypothetical protein
MNPDMYHHGLVLLAHLGPASALGAAVVALGAAVIAGVAVRVRRAYHGG